MLRRDVRCVGHEVSCRRWCGGDGHDVRSAPGELRSIVIIPLELAFDLLGGEVEAALIQRVLHGRLLRAPSQGAADEAADELRLGSCLNQARAEGAKRLERHPARGKVARRGPFQSFDQVKPDGGAEVLGQVAARQAAWAQ